MDIFLLSHIINKYNGWRLPKGKQEQEQQQHSDEKQDTTTFNHCLWFDF